MHGARALELARVTVDQLDAGDDIGEDHLVRVRVGVGVGVGVGFGVGVGIRRLGCSPGAASWVGAAAQRAAAQTWVGSETAQPSASSCRLAVEQLQSSCGAAVEQL